MKKYLLTLPILMFTMILSANSIDVSLNSGYFIPNDADAGVLTGLEFSYQVNNNLRTSLSVSYYQQTHNSDRTVYQTDFPYREFLATSDIESSLIPIMVNFDYLLPDLAVISPFVGGGLGVSFAEDKSTVVTGTDEKVNQNLNYMGLTARFRSGINFSLTPRINLSTQVFYLYSNLTKQLDLSPHGHIDTSLDLSGPGIATELTFRMF